MKYWGYLALKVSVVGATLGGVWPLFRLLLPKRGAEAAYVDLQQKMWQDLGYVAGVYGFLMVVAGLLWMAIWDQRYRCRTCLRRLRMPIARGSWSRLLTGRPHMEYICPYGHGTLKVPELHLTGKEPNAWAEHQDIWTELELLDTEKR